MLWLGFQETYSLAKQKDLDMCYDKVISPLSENIYFQSPEKPDIL